MLTGKTKPVLLSDFLIMLLLPRDYDHLDGRFENTAEVVCLWWSPM